VILQPKSGTKAHIGYCYAELCFLHTVLEYCSVLAKSVQKGRLRPAEGYRKPQSSVRWLFKGCESDPCWCDMFDSVSGH